jgi:hypothetical protein
MRVLDWSDLEKSIEDFGEDFDALRTYLFSGNL